MKPFLLCIEYNGDKEGNSGIHLLFYCRFKNNLKKNNVLPFVQLYCELAACGGLWF